MAISTVSSSELVYSATTATTKSITLPATINPGDFIFIVCSTQETSDVGAPTSIPSGFTQEFSTTPSGSFKPRITFVYKFADGTEDSTSASFTWSSATSTHMVCHVLDGVDPNTPFDVTWAGPTSGSNNPDPAALTTVTDSSWVWAIAAASNSAGAPAVSAISSGYTNAFDQSGAGDNRAFVTTYRENVTASIENPSQWTWSTLQHHTTVTVALRPSTITVTMPVALSLTATATAVAYGSATLASSLSMTASGTAAATGTFSASMSMGFTATGYVTSIGNELDMTLGMTVSALGRNRGVVFTTVGLKALFDQTWDFATDSTVHLFTNDPSFGITAAAAAALTAADFTEAEWTGYASQTLTSSDWTVAAGDPTTATASTVTFNCTADVTATQVYGYMVRRTSDMALIYFDVFVDGPVTVENNGDSVAFAPLVEFT